MSNYNDLSEAIMDYLQEEVEDIEDEVTKVTNELSKQAVNELKQVSKEKFIAHDKWFPYYAGWTKQILNPWGYGSGIKKWSKYLSNKKYIVRIHNHTNYQLTHLLEFGHIKRNGNGYTKAVPHIRPIEEKYNSMYETRLTTAIRTRAYDNKGRRNREKK